MPEPAGSVAAYLDRDGVINFDRGYVHREQDFVFIDGVIDAARRLQSSGYRIVVVTNQSGIGRGLYSEDQFLKLDAWMRGRFASAGVDVATYYCPHHPTDAEVRYRRECDCRKPAPGMLIRSASDLGMDLKRSLMIGDRESDLLAARSADVPHRFLVGTDGLGVPPPLQDALLATGRFRSLQDAVAHILSED